MKTLGIIGFGNFGRFAASYLKADFEVRVFDHNDVRLQAKKAGVKAVSLQEAAHSDIVVLAVPVQAMDAVLEQIAPQVKKDAIVVDVASVKEKPAALMEKNLPKGVQIIGTHPLFGPQSGKSGIAGFQIILCPVRAEKKTVGKVQRVLEELGLHVLGMTTAEHDAWMAKTQAIAHVIGHAAKELELPQAPFKLATYDALLRLRDLVKDDSDALFETIQNENPASKTQRKRLRERLNTIEERLNRK